MLKNIGIILTVCVFLFSASVFAELKSSDLASSYAVLDQINEALAFTAEKATKSVVNISSSKIIEQANPFKDFERSFGSPFPFFFDMPGSVKVQSLGSGIIIDGEKGYILTNNHVVQDAEEIKVLVLDENGSDKSYDAKIKGTDPKSEVAVLEIIDLKDKLPQAILGDSDSVKVGHMVMAIGSPFGYKQTVTTGIVSAKERVTDQMRDIAYQNFIQTDAAINQGNSGGPLLDIKGRVIGVNTFIASTSMGSEGVGFAIPINLAKSIMNSLIEKGKVERGWLGVEISDISDDIQKRLDLDDKTGAFVQSVFEGGPAESAGIKAGDIIKTFDGKKIKTKYDLINIVGATEVGKNSVIEVYRPKDKKTLKLSSIVTERTIDQTLSDAGDIYNKLGITVQNLSNELAGKYGYKQNEGVLISAIKQGSPAANKRLAVGMLILEVDWIPVSNIDEFKNAIKKAKPDKGVLLRLKTQDRTFYEVIELK